jgi:hypothetical protein
MKFLLPQGIGDSVWALHKIQSIRNAQDPGGPIDVYLTCSDRNQLQDRALDFIRRFDFISDTGMRLNYGLHRNNGTDRPPFTPGGYWDYLDDGMYEFKGERYCVLVPNAPLERGIRLEQWLPQYAINWDLFSHFRITGPERAYGKMISAKLGPFCVFYPGPLGGNTTEGHNRNMLWKPDEWIALGKRIHDDLGLHIVTVGAAYDHDYFRYMLQPRMNGASSHWTDLIGRTSLGELWSITSQAKFVISYQAGVGIISTYLGTPTAMWWRARGDSLTAAGFLSFENEMASAWVPPAVIESRKYCPLYYGNSCVETIMLEIESRGWMAHEPSTNSMAAAAASGSASAISAPGPRTTP